MMRRFVLAAKAILLLLIGGVSCTAPSSQPENQSHGEVGVTTPASHRVVSYTPPTIPSMVTDPQERLSYFVSHYWDAFNFADTLLLANDAVVEQAWSNYQVLLPKLSLVQASEALQVTFSKVVGDSIALQKFLAISEKYLYDPNSPMRNEEYFIPILEYILASSPLDEAAQLRYGRMLTLAHKNRVGATALNFSYTLASGKSHSMHSIKADYTLLFFNNPECEDCQRVKEYIVNSALFGELTNASQLVILALYPESDLSLWETTPYPHCMIKSYDARGRINSQQLYDLKAMPTLYLLDAEKKVILKDATVEEVERWLQAKRV